ncbi:MAG: DUF4412 domain-containing protein [Bdellovibrionota bacterium]
MQKLWLGLCLVSTAVYAADGIHMTYEMQMDIGDQKNMQMTTQYYYKDGDTRVEVEGSPLGKTVLLESKGKKYTLFPAEKTYMEVTDFAAQVGQKQQAKMQANFTATGTKKTIAGYPCEVYTKQDKQEQQTTCFSASLAEKYAPLLQSMQSVHHEVDTKHGIPLEMISISNGKTTKVKALAIDHDVAKISFTIPKDYTQKTPEGMPDQLQKMLKEMNAQGNTNMDAKQIEALKKMAEEMQKKYGK